MTLRWAYLAMAVAVLSLGTWLRFQGLDARPMHGDEANQAIKAGVLLEEGKYAYDPFEHHGPTLYYGVLPILWLSGAGTVEEMREWQVRLLPALCGVALLLVVLGFRPALGNAGTLWALWFTALSHGMVYYSRYFIQEIPLVLTLALLGLAIYRYVRRPSLGCAVTVGLAVGLAQATKETAPVLFVCMGAALAVCLLAAAWLRLEPPVSHVRSLMPPIGHWVGLVLTAVIVFVVLYSSFFTQPRGVLDAFQTYLTYLNRAEGHGSTALHDKPWHYYLGILAYTHREAGPRWTEGLALGLAGIGLMAAVARALRRREPADEARLADRLFPLGLAVYMLMATVAFSLIPYKTPWNLLPFLQPMLLLAGYGAGALVRLPRRRVLGVTATIFLLVASLPGLRQTWQGTTVYAADTRNPYVYAHTSTALMKALATVEGLAGVHPAGTGMRVDIIKPDRDYWPLPWYLRGYTGVAYWQRLPPTFEAPVVITEPVLAGAVSEMLGGKEYVSQFVGLRPGTNLVMFVERGLWEQYVAGRTAESG